MYTIPENAFTATISAQHNLQPLYALPIPKNPIKNLPNGTTVIVLGRDMLAQWVQIVVLEDKAFLLGWIPATSIRNVMGEGRLITTEKLPTADYAYHTRQEVYRIVRYQRSLRGVAGIGVYATFLGVFTVISIIIGAIVGVLFIQQAPDITARLFIGMGLGLAIGMGIGWILAFIPMARHEPFQRHDAHYKALYKVYRQHDGQAISLKSQMDLEQATAKVARSVR